MLSYIKFYLQLLLIEKKESTLIVVVVVSHGLKSYLIAVLCLQPLYAFFEPFILNSDVPLLEKSTVDISYNIISI